MKETKTVMKFFTIMQWEEEQNYLRNQHRKGWRFVRASLLNRYQFERCEPEDVVYQLDYSAARGEEKENYIQLFRDCGWEYIQDWYGYSYFRKPAAQMNGDESIFCDKESRMDFLKRVFIGRLIPMIIIFVALIMPQLLMQTAQGFTRAVLGILAVLYVVVFISYGVHYWKYQNDLKE